MAETETTPIDVAPTPTNAFDGLTFGQSVLKLKSNPDLAPDFDSRFSKDLESIDSYERIRLHSIHSYVTSTTPGSVGFAVLKNSVENPLPKREEEDPTQSLEQRAVAEASQAAAARMRRQGRQPEKLALTTEEINKQKQKEYEDLVGDLTKYELMRDAQGFGENFSAVLGVVAGSFMAPENFILNAPQFITNKIMLSRGWFAAGRAAEGGITAGATNMVVDPFTQLLSVHSELQEGFDKTQFALSGPIGFVIGGGLVGAGQIVTNTAVKRQLARMAQEDPLWSSGRTNTIMPPGGNKPVDLLQQAGTPAEPTAAQGVPLKLDPAAARDAGLTGYDIRRLQTEPDDTKVRQINEGYSWVGGEWRKVTEEDIVSARKSVDDSAAGFEAKKAKLDEAFEANKYYPSVSSILGSDWQAAAGAVDTPEAYKKAAYRVLENMTARPSKEVERLERVLARGQAPQEPPTTTELGVVTRDIETAQRRAALQAETPAPPAARAVEERLALDELRRARSADQAQLDRLESDALATTRTPEQKVALEAEATALREKIAREDEILREAEKGPIGEKEEVLGGLNERAAREAGLPEATIDLLRRSPDDPRIAQVNEGFALIDGEWRKVTETDVHRAYAAIDEVLEAHVVRRDKMDAAFERGDYPDMASILGKDWKGPLDSPAAYRAAAYQALDEVRAREVVEAARIESAYELSTGSELRMARDLLAAAPARAVPEELGAAPPSKDIADRIRAAYDELSAETGKKIVDAGPLAKRAGLTPEEFAAWADARPDSVRHLSSTYSKMPQAQKNKLVVSAGEGRPSREFYGFEFPPKTPEELGTAAVPEELEGQIKRTQTGATIGRSSIAPGGEESKRPQGVAATGPQKEVLSLHKMVQRLVDVFDITVRQGKQRMQMKNALGVFKTRQHVIRVVEYPDFEVVVHEMGHAFEFRMADLRALIHQHNELVKLDYDPMRFTTDPSTARTEGFAEFLRRYISNPAAVANEVPNFAPEFIDFMKKKHPDMLALLDETHRLYADYLAASSKSELAAIMYKPKPETWSERVLKKLSMSGTANTVEFVLHEWYSSAFDEKAAFGRVVRALAGDYKERTGKLAPRGFGGSNIEALARTLQRTGQLARSEARYGIVPYKGTQATGPSMRDVLVAAHGHESSWMAWDQKIKDDFDQYLVARVGIYYWDEYLAGRGGYTVPLPASRENLQVAFDELTAKYPQFKHASDLYHDFNRNILRKAYDAGLYGMTTDAYNRIIKQPFYAPLARDVQDKPGAGPSRPGTPPMETVARRKGSERDVISPTDQTLLYLELLERKIADNQLTQAVVDISKRLGGGKWVEDIPAHEVQATKFEIEPQIRKLMKDAHVPDHEADLWVATLIDLVGHDKLLGTLFKNVPTRSRGEPIKFYSKNGQLKAVRLISEQEMPGYGLYELMTTMPTYQQDMAIKVMSLGSGLLQKTVVVDWGFAVANFFRDQMVAAAAFPGYIPFYHGVKGLFYEYTQGDIARRYREGGGVLAGHQLLSVEEAARANLADLSKRGYLAEHMTSWKGMADLITSTEMGTRLSVFQKVEADLVKQGVSKYDAMREAAWRSSDMLDFGRYGSRFQAARNTIPFLNPYMQALDFARRKGITPIIRKVLGNEVFDTDSKEAREAIYFWGKIGAVGFGLGFGWAALNSESEWYLDMSPEARALHFGFGTEKGMITAPKPWELGLGFTAGEMAFLRLFKEDPRQVENFIESAFEVLKPPIMPPLVKAAVEPWTNYNFYTKRPLVPERLAGRDPYLQYNSRTSPTAKAVGEVLNVSPIKVDQTIGNLFGTWGRYARDFSKAFEDETGVARMQDNAFLRRYEKDAWMISDAPKKFWEYMGRTSGTYYKAQNSYDSLVEDPRGDPQAYFDKLDSNRKVWVTLQSAGDDDEGRPKFDADDRRVHPLERGRLAVIELSKLREDVASNRIRDVETKEHIPLTKESRKKLTEAISILSMKEFRNALVILEEPGYAGRPLMDLSSEFAIIRETSPEVALNLQTIYATRKIYKTSAVALNYKNYRDEILAGGGDAEVSGITSDIVSDGYEFDGERVPRRKRRVPIPGPGR